MGSSDDVRRSELVASLGALRGRIADACAAAGRPALSVTLIAITKTYPAADAATLAELGVGDMGESRDQEASAKAAAVRELLPQREVRWHFVGRLQRKKSRSVASYAHAVHSVDRPELATALADAVRAEIDHAGRAPMQVFVQASLDGDPGRGGVVRAELPAVADAVARRPELILRGVMAVAPLDADPEAAFADLATLSEELRTRHPDADAISAGMSQDLEQAVSYGATHLRVGTALLGRRPPILG